MLSDVASALLGVVFQCQLFELMSEWDAAIQHLSVWLLYNKTNSTISLWDNKFHWKGNTGNLDIRQSCPFPGVYWMENVLSRILATSVMHTGAWHTLNPFDFWVHAFLCLWQGEKINSQLTHHMNRKFHI